MLLQIVFGAALHSPATVEVAPVCACKVGSVIHSDRSLAFEKYINIKVSFETNGITF